MKTLDHPFVVGLIGKNLNAKGHKLLKRRFSSAFKRAGLDFVYLLLKVEPRYLKNLITCMRLMDVVGINVSKEYQKKVIPYLDRLDESVRVVKTVNTIAKHRQNFVGYYVKEEGLIQKSIAIFADATICDRRP